MSDRLALIRLASSLPVGSEERREILKLAQQDKTAAVDFDFRRGISFHVRCAVYADTLKTLREAMTQHLQQVDRALVQIANDLTQNCGIPAGVPMIDLEDLTFSSVRGIVMDNYFTIKTNNIQEILANMSYDELEGLGRGFLKHFKNAGIKV